MKRILVWTRDQGITDDMFKDGDIFKVYADDETPGTQETKRWLCVEVEEIVGVAVNWEDLVAPEMAVSSGSEPASYRRVRKYRLEYASKLTPEELASARDPEADLQPITGRFTVSDIVRK